MAMTWNLALVAALVVLGGCSESVLMRTPSIVSDGELDPFVRVPESRRSPSAPVFVASTRTVTGDDRPPLFYSKSRSDRVRIGLADVHIGAEMTWEELAAESRAADRHEEPKVVLASYEEFGELWTTAPPPGFEFKPHWDGEGMDKAAAERFADEIDAMLEGSHRQQITIFVHGFNTEFAKNVQLTAEFWHYMGRDGAALCFEWPSEGSMFSYQKDKANADLAIRHFRELLVFLAERTSVNQINIIGHSAGTPIVVEALRHLSLIQYDVPNEEARRRSKIGRVVLAAPDMDLDVAVSAGMDGAGRVTQGLLIYASTRDKALHFAADIFGDVRVGRSIGKLTDDEMKAIIDHDAQWVDVTNAQKRHSSFLGHSYFHLNPWVSTDAMIFLAVGARAEERGLVRNPETAFLEFPDDYEERMPAMVEALREKYGLDSAQWGR